MAKKQAFEFFFNQLVKGYRSIMGKDPEGLDLIKIKQEARQKLIDQDKVIEVQFGKPFGEEVNKLIESGDVKIGEVTKKNDNVLQREMFQNSNLNKPTIEGQMEKITGASNRIDEIMKEQADMYRPKTDAEIKAKFERQNKEAAERLRKKMKDEPEDKADGGRMGFAGGKIVLGKKILNLLKNNKKIQEAVDNIFGTGDYKMDAEMAAESLVELNPTTFGNKLYEDLDDMTRSEIYGAVLKPITTNMAKMRELKKASRPEKTLAAMKEGKGIDMSDPGIAEEFTRFMKETDPEGSKKLEQTVELANFDPKKVKGNAEGGRIGYYTGGITDIEPDLSDIGHGSDSLMARTRLVSPDGQATTSTGLNYLLAEDNDNIRVPFAKGKIAKEIVDKGRRGFMKAAGAAGAGIAALKTGLLGLGEKTAPVVEKVAETVSETAKGVPPYFFRLVEKIKFMGDSTLATKDKANAYKFKDYVMEEDFAGNIEIIKKGEDLGGNKLEDVYMSYKVDEVPVKGKKGSAKIEEYEEFTARPDAEGKMKDVEPGIPDEVIEEAGDIDAMTLKKAEGGRIGMLAGGGILKAILKNSADAKGMTVRDFIMAMNPKSIPSNIKNLISKVDLEQLKAGYKDYYENISDMMKTRFDFQKNIEGGKTTPARELFEDMEKTMDKQSYVPKTVTQDDISKIELMLKNKFNKGRKDNAQGGIQTMLGE